MRTIRTLDVESGYAVVEPGVTQRELATALDGSRWMLNVTSSCADTSVIGNAVDRGDGTIRPRTQDILGVEAVLADGTVVTTGGLDAHGRYGGRPAGPDLTQAFIQSNLGIVTAMAVSLIPRPESIHLVRATFQRETVGKVLDELVAASRRGLPTAGMLRMRELFLIPADGDYLLPGGADPDTFAVMVPLLGTEAAVAESTRILTAMFDRLDGLTSARILDTATISPDDPLLPRAHMAQGIPDCGPIRTGLRSESCEVDDGDTGWLTFLPLVGLGDGNPARALELMQRTVDDHPTALAAEFNLVSPHWAHMVVQIAFERTEEATARAHALLDTARERFLQAGFAPYRSNIDHAADEIAARGATAELRILNMVKALLDTHNLIAPGRFLHAGAHR